MAERSVVIIGLPASGKTTYLAALWHLIFSREVNTKLVFRDLREGEFSHLNAIAKRWRNAVVQERTAVAGNRLVSMNLLDVKGQAVRVTFPDLPGETFTRMWTDRSCDPQTADALKGGHVLLFVHADTIRTPSWIVDEVEISKEAGLTGPDGENRLWDPILAPTQVQLVDLLQLLRLPPLDLGPRRLAVMLTAWDKARGERLVPERYLKVKLPLLYQYLLCSVDDWTWRVYGLSAQGGEYDNAEKDVAKRDPKVEDLRNLDLPSKRIQLVGPEWETHDLTDPLAWLSG